MSRSRAMHAFAAKLGAVLDIEITAHYDDYYGRDRGWHLTWVDGPPVETLRTHAVKAARHLPQVDAPALRYRRDETAEAVIAAFVAYVETHPADAGPAALHGPSYDALRAYDHTDIGRLDPRVREIATFVVERIGVRGAYDEADQAIAHIAKIGLNAIRIDMWLADSSQADWQLSPPALDPAAVSPEARSDLARALDRVTRELTGRTDHANDPRVQLLVTETLRDQLVEQIRARQRHTLALALAERISLSSLSRMMGLSKSTLGMRYGPDLDIVLTPLTWLRDNAAEWAEACARVAKILEGNLAFRAELRSDITALRPKSTQWRSLIGTPEIARRVLHTIGSARVGAEPAFLALRDLLLAHDTAPPPSRRERHLRRPINAALPASQRSAAHPGGSL